MANNLPKGIVYVTKTKLVLYVQGSPAVYTLEFKPTYIRDLEIINDDELDREVKAFVEANKIPPSDVGIVLADSLLFEKKLEATIVNKEEEIKKYIEDIPFDDTSYQKINEGPEVHVVVANTHFYTLLIEAFRVLGFNTIGVIPAKVVSSQFATSENIDVNAAAFLTSKFTSYLGFNFMKPVVVNPEEIGSVEPEKPKKSHEKELVGVFIMLLLFMVGLYYMLYMRQPVKTKVKAVGKTTPAVIIPTTPVVTVIPTIAPESSSPSATFTPPVTP